jgi:hypothetical protein
MEECVARIAYLRPFPFKYAINSAGSSEMMASTFA